MKAIKSDNISLVLRECFSSDEELLNKYHIASGMGLDACVNRTASDLLKAKDFSFFEIRDEDNTLVGYFGAEEPENIRFLTGFFIHPAYRTKERIGAVWGLINKYFIGRPFVTGVYAKNERAIKFLERNGGTLVANLEHDGHSACLFGFNLEK